MPEVKFRGLSKPNYEKLGAVKAFRETFGLGLREAVDMINGLNLAQAFWIRDHRAAEEFVANTAKAGYKFEFTNNPDPDMTVTLTRSEYDALAAFMFPHLVEMFKEHCEAAKRDDREKMRATYELRRALDKLQIDPMDLVMPGAGKAEPAKDE